MAKRKPDYRDRYAPDGDKVVTLTGLRSKRQLELECALNDVDAAAEYFAKTVKNMRAASENVTRAMKRLEKARTAMKRR